MRMNLFCCTNSIIQRKYTYSGNMTNLTSRVWMKLSAKENFISCILIYTIWTVTCQRTVSSGVDALCILYKRLAFPCWYTDMVPTFGRNETELCLIYNHVWLYLHSTPLSFAIMEPIFLRPILKEYAMSYMKRCTAGKLLWLYWRYCNGDMQT